MSSEHDLERALRTWLREGLESLPDRYLDAALDEISATNQRRRGALAWRPSEMNMFARYGLAVAAVLVVAILGLTFLFNNRSRVANPPTPTPAATATPLMVHLSDGGFAVPLTYDAPASWTTGPGSAKVTRVVEGAPRWGLAWYSGVRLMADPCHPRRGFVTPAPGPNPEDLAAALKALPGLTVTDPVAYTSPGHSGVMVDIRYIGPWTCESTGIETIPFAQLSAADRNATDMINPAYEVRWFITQVHGTRIVIEAWSEGTPLAKVMSQIQPIIDSMRFR